MTHWRKNNGLDASVKDSADVGCHCLATVRLSAAVVDAGRFTQLGAVVNYEARVPLSPAGGDRTAESPSSGNSTS